MEIYNLITKENTRYIKKAKKLRIQLYDNQKMLYVSYHGTSFGTGVYSSSNQELVTDQFADQQFIRLGPIFTKNQSKGLL